MKSQVNFVYDIEDDPVDELKHWLFLENVRLNQQRQQLEYDLEELDRMKEKLEKEKRQHNRELDIRERNCKEKKTFSRSNGRLWNVNWCAWLKTGIRWRKKRRISSGKKTS